MARYTRLTATVIFSGDLDPDVSAAMIALARAGFAVTAMPEAYRPLLCHPRDDFLEATQWAIVSNDENQQIALMMNEVNRIVDKYGAMVDEGGVADDDRLPFASFTEWNQRVDDVKEQPGEATANIGPAMAPTPVFAQRGTTSGELRDAVPVTNAPRRPFIGK